MKTRWITTALAVFGLLLGTSAPAADTDANWGARSLRGLSHLHLEMTGTTDASDEDEVAVDPAKDPKAFLMDFLKSQQIQTGSTRTDSLKAATEATLATGTPIKLHPGSLAEAEKGGLPILMVTVLRKDKAGKRRAPHEISFELRQQVQLARDNSFRFYATTFQSGAVEDAGEQPVRQTLSDLTDRFVEVWKAAN